jgi:hypothetical protein
MKLCKNCAHEVGSTALVCPFCGNTLVQTKKGVVDETKTKQSHLFSDGEKGPNLNNEFVRGPYQKWLSITLCLLLGWLGAHKFYEGKYIMGLFYAVTFGFWGVGIVLDLIQLCGKKKYYYVSKIPFLRI